MRSRPGCVAMALHHHAIVAWQDFGVDDADEFSPAANGVDLVLLHEPDRLHEIHQQHNSLLSHEANARVPEVGSLRLGGWIFLLLHVSPSMLSSFRNPDVDILDRIQSRAKNSGEQAPLTLVPAKDSALG